MTPGDRRALLFASADFNGIDYVEVLDRNVQTGLRVHFINKTFVGKIDKITITGGETLAAVPVTFPDPTVAANWGLDAEKRPTFDVTAAFPGDFSTYTFAIDSPKIDPYFARVPFSFKALCPSDVDCEPPVAPCPIPSGDVPPIDYTAKDFLGFRRALSDFSAHRYPGWQERDEPDVGMMLMEAMCAVADDLSYTQDRIARERSLEEATQYRSLVRHARLVDYEPRMPTASSVVLQFNVQTASLVLPKPVIVRAAGPDGERIEFETGRGLGDATVYTVRKALNHGIVPYWLDDSRRCLRAGSTEMWIVGHAYALMKDTPLLLDTAAAVSADPHVRETVLLLHDAVEELDALFPPGGPPTPITHLTFKAPLVADHDLTRTTLAGNLVPATQGRTYQETFGFPTRAPSLPAVISAVARTGSNAAASPGAYAFSYTLARADLAWLPSGDPGGLPVPEITLVERGDEPVPWRWLRRLVDAERHDTGFTLERGAFRRVMRFADGTDQLDYDGDDGDTIRFGDGVFGALPNDDAIFDLAYRVANGARGNVNVDSIATVDEAFVHFGLSVTNPYPSTGGADIEPPERIKALAPYAFRATQYRAVTRTDYEAAAQTLAWVARAGTAFRWTGSWLTVFTTPDPHGTDVLSVDHRTELIDLLNRYRLAGYESYVPDPVYVSLDLQVSLCAHRSAFRGDVELAVLAALRTTAGGFFDHDSWTFGKALERGALEAAIQNAPGVDGVLSLTYRRRGLTNKFVTLPPLLTIGVDQLVRCDNDPNRPDAGTITVTVGGGK